VHTYDNICENLLLQKAIAVITAHDSLIAAMSFSPSGQKLATASEKV